MANTDKLYKSRVHIDGILFEDTSLWSARIINKFFNNTMQIGCTACAEIELKITEPSITFSRMAEIIPEVCLEGSDGPWEQLGVYYIDTRNVIKGRYRNLMQITGYDGMLKTSKEIDFSSLTFPAKTSDVVVFIANYAGINVEQSTIDYLDNGTTIPKPEYYTGREVLGFIGVMHGGSFMMSNKGYLKFVSMSDVLGYEYGYLVTQDGTPILIGGEPILV